MELALDPDVQAVAEFMQKSLTAAKLISVADVMPNVARLLWSQYPQEPCVGLKLSEAGVSCDSPRDASVSGPVPLCVDGDSVAATDNRLQM